MFDKYFSLIYKSISNNKWLVLGLVLVIYAAALAGLYFIKLDGNIELMLPSQPEIARSMKFLKDSNISNKIVISLALNSPEKGKAGLFQAADQLATSLKPPLFTKVNSGMSQAGAMDDMKFFMGNAPQILTADDLASLDKQITQKSVSARMQRIYLQLMKPEGVFMGSRLRSDPLGIDLMVLNKLKTLSNAMGYKVNLEDGHFISADGRHTMLIVQTPVLVTDIPRATKLMQELDNQIGKLPDYISADVISGFAHTLSNERIMQRDVWLVNTIAAISFLLLFGFVFKDVNAIPIFVIPVFAVIQAINLCYLFQGVLSYMAIGLGALVAGVSDDYGIHVYIAARNGEDIARSVRQIARPVTIGVITTLAVFFTFFLSHIGGYHQLAFLAILSIAISMCYSLFILPQFLSRRKTRPWVEERLENYTLSNAYTTGIWALLTLIFLLFSFNIRFDNNIYKIDGTETKILQAEERFQQIWGKERLAMFVAAGSSYEAALEQNDRIYRAAVKLIGAENFSSLSGVWPSGKTRKENLEHWQKFWRDGREEKLKTLIQQEGTKYDFSEAAFSPFFDKLHESENPVAPGFIPGQTGGGQAPALRDPVGNEFFSNLKERFIQKTQDGYKIVSFFPDRESYTQAMLNLSLKFPGAFVVSGTALPKTVSAAVQSDVKLMLIISSIAVLILTFLFFWNIRETLIALIPVATSIIWLLGIMSILGQVLNVANLVSSVILLALCVDYGIFMVFKCRENLKTGITMSVTISAVTTVIGAAVLIFARHPALFTAGLALSVGIGTGYLSSLLVVPYLHQRWVL